MSKKAKDCFHSQKKKPVVIDQSAYFLSQSSNPSLIETAEAKIIRRKQLQIRLKRAQLEKRQSQNLDLCELVQNHEQQIEQQIQQLEVELGNLHQSLQQIHKEIRSMQKLEKIDPDKYMEWRLSKRQQAHFQKLEIMKKKFSEENTKKIQEINAITTKGEKAKAILEKAEIQLQMQRGIMVQDQQVEEIQMPNIRQMGEELISLRDKICSLKDLKELMTMELKETLNTDTWPVKKKFEDCKQRIANEMNRLLTALEKNDKSLTLQASSEKQKITNPITLIQEYEKRLLQIQKMLPQQSKTEEVLNCCKPLPWRSIKGSGIDPATSPTSQIHNKFSKLQSEFMESQSKNTKLKKSIKDKDKQIEKLQQMLNNLQDQIKQYNI